jgi:hypothetical protein
MPTTWPEAVFDIVGMLVILGIVLALHTDFWERIADRIRRK